MTLIEEAVGLRAFLETYFMEGYVGYITGETNPYRNCLAEKFWAMGHAEAEKQAKDEGLVK